MTNVVVQQAVNLMITAHCLMTITLLMNPLNQQAEEWFQVPQTFGIKRCLVRGAVLLSILFIGETIPSFDNIMGLVGGSTVAFMSIIFPCLFYMYLSAAEQNINENKIL